MELGKKLIKVARAVGRYLTQLFSSIKRQRGGVLALSIIVLAFLLFSSIFFVTIYNSPNYIWTTVFIDRVVYFLLIISIAFILFCIYVIMIFDDTARDRILKNTLVIGGVFATIVTLFVSYATLRSQVRLSTEASLREEGLKIFELEMSNPKIRCLYDNQGHAIYDQCLSMIVEKEEDWSYAIFYVEESWWLIEQASTDSLLIGSEYSNIIQYWRKYLREDPTGLFTYFIVNDRGSVEEAVAFMKYVNVEPINICKKYTKVWNALAAKKAFSMPKSGVRAINLCENR